MLINDFRLFSTGLFLLGGKRSYKMKGYKMKKLMKKVASKLHIGYIAAALCLVGSSAMAEGELTFDTAQITAAQLAVSTGMKSIITGAVPVVGAIVVAGLVIWGIFWIVDLLKKAGSKAKGR